MKTYGAKIAPFIRNKLAEAKLHRSGGDARSEFSCLEDAHVLGQESTYWHTRIHIEMLLWGIRNASLGEVGGQLLRIVGALTKTAIGLIPEGNTGGSNVSPFKKMPIRDDLLKTMRQAQLRA